MFYSPLRYPGGKNKLAAFVAKICIDNKIDGHYVEPYSGGASVALFLLLEGYVKRITINDMDRSLYAFWYSVLNKSEDLCKLIDDTELNIVNWKVQREVQNSKESADLLELGFSTLFLNRTNRSGIIRGGVIGGTSQDGDYKIDCRFNKEQIKKRIRLIASRKESISLYQEDAVNLIDKIEAEQENSNAIFYFDPPYYLKAESLYMNHYAFENHKAVSDRISKIKKLKWIVSYDNNDNIQKLYSEFPKKEYSFNHSAYVAREGKEILFFSNGLVSPNIPSYNPIYYKLKKSSGKSEILYIEPKPKGVKTKTKSAEK